MEEAVKSVQLWKKVLDLGRMSYCISLGLSTLKE
jgi:hypothetical protein